MNNFIYLGMAHLMFKSDSKYIYSATKYLYFK